MSTSSSRSALTSTERHKAKILAFEGLLGRFSVFLDPFLGILNARLLSVNLISDETCKKADINATLSELLERLKFNEKIYEAFGSVLLGLNRCRYLFNNLVSRFKKSERAVCPHLTGCLSLTITATGKTISTILPEDTVFVSENQVIFYGLPNVGKTSLQDTLLKRPLSSMDSTVLANIRPVCCKSGDYQGSWVTMTETQQENMLNESEILLNLWDCGSQRIFSDILPSFLQQNTLFLLVFDASKFAKEQKDELHHQQEESVLFFLQKWIAFIHGFFKTAYNFKPTELLKIPPIILVGTHADQLTEREMTAKEILDKIYLSIVGCPYSMMVLDGFIVDTTKRGEAEDKEISKLRKTITQFTEMNEHEVPACWIPFRNALIQYKQNQPVISLDEVQKVAITYKIPKEDVPNALFYFSGPAVFLFFPHVKRLEKVLFLEPQWIVECFKKILYYDNKDMDSDMKKMQGILTRFGILLEPFYCKVLHYVKEHIEPQGLVELLCSRYLAAPVSTSSLHKWIGKQEYFLPFMLGENVLNQKNLWNNGILKASSLHLIFNDGFVPPGYFVQLACYLAAIGDIFCLDHSSYYSHISFHVCSIDHVTILEHAKSIEIYFVRLTPNYEVSFRESCATLVSYLVSGIEKLKKISFAAYGRLVHSCPCCNAPAFSLPSGVQFMVTFWSEVQSYFQCQNNHHFLLTHSHRLWIKPLTKDLTAAEVKGAFLSPEEVHDIVSKIAPSELSIVVQELEVINPEATQNSEDLFLQWCNYSGDRIELAQALRAVNMDHYVTELISKQKDCGKDAELHSQNNSNSDDQSDKIVGERDSESTQKYNEEEKNEAQHITGTKVLTRSTEQKKVWNLQYDVDVTKQQEEISQCLHAPAEEVKDEMAQKKTDTVSIGVQFNYLVPMSANLRGVKVVGEKLFEINGACSQLLEWEEYGFRIQVPAGAFSGPCDIAVKAIISGQFELPKETELASALYAITASRTLEKPVCVEIEHCVRLENEQDCKFLCFGVATCSQETLPYTFEMLDDGLFSPCHKFGKIYRNFFSILGVLKRFIPFMDTLSSHSEADDNEQLQTDDLVSKTAEDKSCTASDAINEQSVATQSSSIEQKVQTLSSSTEDLKSVSDALIQPELIGPVNQYVARVFLECRGVRNFSWKFAVIKDLVALTTFVKENHICWQERAGFKFEFTSSILVLELPEEQEVNGWSISPEIYPCVIRQVDVDSFLENSLLPCCEVTVVAKAGEGTAEHLHYSVPILNINPNRKVSIQLSKQLSPRNGHRYHANQDQTHQDELHREPTMRELLNEVSAEASDKWVLIGTQLDIEDHHLENFSRTNTGDIYRCHLQVFRMWRNKGSPPYTWATIINVLRSKIVGEVRLADKLELLIKSQT